MSLQYIIKEILKKGGDAHQSSLHSCKDPNKRTDDLLSVLGGIIDGNIDIGSITPVHGIPRWVTLKCSKEGFATGELLASLKKDDAYNEIYLTEEGIQKLYSLLDSKCYRIECAENGVFLVLAYLRRNGCISEERELMEKIIPFFKKLKFYPDITDIPIVVSKTVCISTVSDIIKILTDNLNKLTDLNSIVVRNRVSYYEANSKWLPFTHKLLALFLRTCECEHYAKYCTEFEPEVHNNNFKKGKIRHPREKIIHTDCPCHEDAYGCGWPLQKFPEGWFEEAKEILDEYKKIRHNCYRYVENFYDRKTFSNKSVEKFINNKFFKEGSMLNIMVECLKECVEHRITINLSAKIVGRLHNIIANFNSTRGLPGSQSFNDYLEHIKKSTRPTKNTKELSMNVVLDRLKDYDLMNGLDNPQNILEPIKLNGKDLEIPDSIRKLVQKCCIGTVSELVEKQIINNSEELALIITQLTAQTISTYYKDPVLKDLVICLNNAFRERKSLLLTEGGQLRFTDLPWVTVLERFRSSDTNTQDNAYSVLVMLVKLSLENFPYEIIPNKLLQSIKELLESTGRGLYPLTEELALDIFRGSFSDKFINAADFCAKKMQDSDNLYVAYYDLLLVYVYIRETPITKDGFKTMCYRRGEIDQSQCLNPLTSYKIIEQQQIITTQNLCVLISVLDIKLDWSNLAKRVWIWILENISTKNVTNAWRQLVYFLSLLDNTEQQIVLDELKGLGTDKSSYTCCIETYLTPLIIVYEGIVSLRRISYNG